MEYINLNENTMKFIEEYRGLPEDQQRLLAYIVRIASSSIFTDEEFADFLKLIR